MQLAARQRFDSIRFRRAPRCDPIRFVFFSYPIRFVEEAEVGFERHSSAVGWRFAFFVQNVRRILVDIVLGRIQCFLWGNGFEFFQLFVEYPADCLKRQHRSHCHWTVHCAGSVFLCKMSGGFFLFDVVLGRVRCVDPIVIGWSIVGVQAFCAKCPADFCLTFWAGSVCRSHCHWTVH